ncbi:MAG: hypothetical protein AVDCRST_MAG68-4624 [uncultured Gemmatimonadetes bacterium]|uniref:Amidohydrolase-related domain-containing protein n=1 Tax=uncultured Gemmatimonadota bacterium TaxID=203437 RepID=A0A6J4MMH1_9BACT|nr:MAG: hypothetical protein AVDCRST_MAG68-4624 [uncultured Gemmatimonadota bacterium]
MLRMNAAGAIGQGARANLVIVAERPLRVVEVISGGRRVVRDGVAVDAASAL